MIPDAPMLSSVDGLREPSVLKEPDSRAKILRAVLKPWIFFPLVALVVASIVLSFLFGASILLADMVPESVREAGVDIRTGALVDPAGADREELSRIVLKEDIEMFDLPGGLLREYQFEFPRNSSSRNVFLWMGWVLMYYGVNGHGERKH
jgi:hypothetical protein